MCETDNVIRKAMTVQEDCWAGVCRGRGRANAWHKRNKPVGERKFEHLYIIIFMTETTLQYAVLFSYITMGYVCT